MDTTTPLLFVHAHKQGTNLDLFERRTLFSLEDTQGHYVLLSEVHAGSERVAFPACDGRITCYIVAGVFTFFQAGSQERIVADQGDIVVLTDASSYNYGRTSSSASPGELLILLTPTQASAQSSHLIRASEGRSYAILTDIGTFKLSGEDTDGVFLLMLWRVPAQGGAALHAQRGQETFFIVEGHFAFRGLREGQPYMLEAAQGDVVHAQERVPHSYQNIGEHPGTMLVVMAPVGQSQQFFQEIGTVTDGSSFPTALPDLQFLLPIIQKYKIDIF